MRLARRCSNACAIHPLTRLIGKRRREQCRVEPEAVQEQRCVELHVGLQPSAGLVLLEQPKRLRLHRPRQRVQRHVARAREHPFGRPREDVGSRIAHLVDAMAEAHQLLAGLDLPAQDSLGPRCVPDLEHHVERRPGAPPCSGPLSAPIAPTTADTRSDPVDVMTRAVNVDALRP